MKTPHHSVSGRSYLASTPDSSNVAVFEVGRVYILTHSINSCFTTLALEPLDAVGLTKTVLCCEHLRVTGFG